MEGGMFSISEESGLNYFTPFLEEGGDDILCAVLRENDYIHQSPGGLILTRLTSSNAVFFGWADEKQLNGHIIRLNNLLEMQKTEALKYVNSIR